MLSRMPALKVSGLLSDDMHLYTDNGNGAAYSFCYNDKLFDFLLEVGLKPIVQLSFMPSALAKDPGRHLFGHLISEPADLSAWRELVQTVTAHLLERYGAEEVRSWHFCVWSQPDTPQEYKTLEALSFPQCSKYLCDAKNGTLEINAMLDMLEVRLVTIEPHP